MFQHPVVTLRSTKHILMTCLMTSQLSAVFFHHIPVLHFFQSRDGYLPPSTSCSSIVFTELSSYIFPTFTRLFLSILLLDAILRTNFVSFYFTDFAKNITLFVSFVFTLIYALVILVPIFFYLYLESASNPCYEGEVILRYTQNADNGKMMSVFSYIIPSVVVAISVILLFFIHLFCSPQNADDKTKTFDDITSNGYNHKVNNVFSKSNHKTSDNNIVNRSGNKNIPASKNNSDSKLANGLNSNSNHKENMFDSYSGKTDFSASKSLSSFDKPIIIAAISAVLLELLFCVRQFAYWDQGKSDSQLFYD